MESLGRGEKLELGSCLGFFFPGFSPNCLPQQQLPCRVIGTSLNPWWLRTKQKYSTSGIFATGCLTVAFVKLQNHFSVSGCTPKYILTDKISPEQSPTSSDSGISSASSTEDSLVKKELSFDSDSKETPIHFTFPKAKPQTIKAEPRAETSVSMSSDATLPAFSMPSVITATAAVAVANSVMSGNVGSTTEEVSPSQEILGRLLN